MASKSITKPLVWILMGLLVLGLAGFGVTSLSGTLRTIGKVGGEGNGNGGGGGGGGSAGGNF